MAPVSVCDRPRRQQPLQPAAPPAAARGAALLAGYAAASLLPLAALVTWLLR